MVGALRVNQHRHIQLKRYPNGEALGRENTLDDIQELTDNVGGVDFQQAAREGNVQVIKQYLNSPHFKRKLDKMSRGKKNPVDSHDSQGICAMHYAARYNHIEIMDILFKSGADLNVRDEDGQTPLHHATRYAPKGTALNPTMVAYVPMPPTLVEIDEDDEDQEREEQEEEEEEEEEEEDQATDVLQDVEGGEGGQGDEEGATRKVPEDVTLSAISKFLKRRVSGRIKNQAEQIAEEEGSPPIRWLAENGADVNAQDDYGLTSLHCAADRGNYPAVLELVKIDAVQVNLRDKQGETALHMAIMYEEVACIKKLIFNKKHPVNPRIASFSNMSPLHLACREASLEIVELIYSRIKSLEIKESLDSILQDRNEDIQHVKQLLLEIGVKGVVNFHAPIATLMRKLQKHAKKVNREAYRQSKGAIDVTFKKAMEQTNLKMKEHVNRQAEEKMTCMHLACKDGRIQVVEYLLNNGADLKLKTLTKETCLHIAAHKGHEEVVQRLVETGSPLESKNSDGETALHECSKTNKTKTMQFLIDAGARINARDRDGSTPLITASAWGHEEAVSLLLNAGADVNARDKHEGSAVFSAIRENNPKVLALILEAGGDKLIDSELDRFQNTPLHFAAGEGHLGCLQVLLKFGFETNAQNEDDKCPLHKAAEKGRKKCVVELVRYDSSTLEDKDDLGNIPLHYSALNGHVEATDFLCDSGAEVGARNQNGWTPLDCAASRGNTKTMATLIDADAEIDPMDKARLTPLHLAAKNGHVDAVCFLLDNGADIRMTDSHELNAIELAILANKRDVAEAIINYPGGTWMRALSNSQQNGDTPMKKLIRTMPEIAELVLNKCTDLSVNPPEMTTDDPNFEVMFNYKYISGGEGSDSLSNNDTKSTISSDLDTESEFGRIIIPHTSESYHIHPLNLMIKYKRNDLLGHPLVASMVFCKWISYGKHFYYGNLFLYMAFLAFLTLYTLTQIPPLESVQETGAGGVGQFVKRENCISEDQADGCGYESKSAVVLVSGIGVMIFSVLRLLIELLQLIYQRHKYISLQNLTEITLFALAIIFAWNSFLPGETIQVWEWQIGVICLLIAWMNFLMFLRKFPGIGIYIVMFVEVLGTFMRIFVVLVLFLVAFGLSFYMVMAQFPSFKNPGYAILRTFVMMTGEMEFDNYFAPENILATTPLYYPESTLIMFVVFVIIVPIVFMNLLVGLAVDDIKAVYDQAELERSIMKIQLIFQVEVLLTKKFLGEKNLTKQKFWPNRRHTVLGSRWLMRYLGPNTLPFDGPFLAGRVAFGIGSDEKAAEDKRRMKMMKREINNISKQNKQMMLLLKRLVLRTMKDDTDSVLSSDIGEIMGENIDIEYQEDD